MKRIELVKGIHSSVLGFGCAPILGAVGSKMAKQAIECALSHDINHFDLARSYGYGDAEHFVGKVIKGQRDKVVLASKFGIKSNWKASLCKPAKPLIRFLKGRRKILPHLTIENRLKADLPDRFHDRIPLTAKTMQDSLIKSLRDLGTDYLDYFFVHEPHQTLICIDELSEMAERLKEEGKIRAWGLAFMRTQKELHTRYLKKFDVLQFDNSPGAPGYNEVAAERGNIPNILFSPLSGGTQELKPTEKLNKLMDDFPKSVIVCSMFNEQHLMDNISSVGLKN